MQELHQFQRVLTGYVSSTERFPVGTLSFCYRVNQCPASSSCRCELTGYTTVIISVMTEGIWAFVYLLKTLELRI